MSSPAGDQVTDLPPAQVVADDETQRERTQSTGTTDIASSTEPEVRHDSPAAEIPQELDEESALKELNTTVRDQEDLERDISQQAKLALIEAEDDKDKKRIARAEARRAKLVKQKAAQREKLSKARNNPSLVSKTNAEIARLESEIDLVDKDIEEYSARIDKRHAQNLDDDAAPTSATGRLPGESQREFLIRTGKITPFSKIGAPRESVVGNLANAIIDAEEEAIAEDLENQLAPDQVRSHRNLRLPGFADVNEDSSTAAAETEFSLRPRKKRRVQKRADSSDEFEPESAATPVSESDGVSEDYDMSDIIRTRQRKTGKASKPGTDTEGDVDFSKIDDGNESIFQQRLADWVERRSRARQRRRELHGLPREDGDVEEWFNPSPDQPDHEFEGGLKLPGDIYPSLFDYQKTGVQWLSELFEQNVGGIVGDEMGLGKTIQIISFIAALHYSKKLTKPVLVVAPATVLQQWVNEFHRWWPPLRVSILHSSGSGMLNVRNERLYEDDDLSRQDANISGVRKSSKAAKQIVDRVVKHGHVLVTTYAGIQTYGDILCPVEWNYAVLDEGHKIRNPNTGVTIYCKELLTPNRIILSGTPMQNNLIELWSLFDFINPMRLGSLVDFRNQFEIPIRLGGYANASKIQIMTAQKCAETLKEAISPYLLQRTKKDVAADLPQKKEQVLFCHLTQRQKDTYRMFQVSEEMQAIEKGDKNPFSGIDHLRKICNHPDLAYPKLKERSGYEWGSENKSGKMKVVKSLLTMWKRLGHKTLLFTQGVQMLNILEAFVRRQDSINYLRMDGTTAIKDRQKLVDRFNNEPEIDLFLLTTKVGGLGLNLTGANRVIIYDPDWNPSTDMQARERAWRLGQKREVTIYRLMTAGTVEEFIYRRQIWKQFLANKVLKDPKQLPTFNMGDLHDLFKFDPDQSSGTTTGRILQGSESNTDTLSKPPITAGAGEFDMPDQHAYMEKLIRNGDHREEELENLGGLGRLEDFNGDEEKGDAAEEEDRIMAGIFAKGVQEALEHDDVMNGGKGKRTIQPDRAILQREADRAAAEAAAHLRRSGQLARNVPIGTVTWTGEVGEAGRPRPSNANRGRAGLGSSGVLAGIRNRQGIASGNSVVGSSSRSGTSTPTNRVYSLKEFKDNIRFYMQRHGGKVPSKVLVDHFGPLCEGNRNAATFKAALDAVATLERSRFSQARAIWTLKPAQM
ncbi:SNF2 family N-terminal domain-domain-containing protein [Coniella lustricola]|uniref:SNF2 family N-terminal domain-domain-containing protein n=1 Tax=Coniella lustricola TaxID=2025994 RepID=A0A2T3A6G4_9PEZI|nr:SNF2 family N-terminal domain-domain-containing protein [Coniella lustricola]